MSQADTGAMPRNPSDNRQILLTSAQIGAMSLIDLHSLYRAADFLFCRPELGPQLSSFGDAIIAATEAEAMRRTPTTLPEMAALCAILVSCDFDFPEGARALHNAATAILKEV